MYNLPTNATQNITGMYTLFAYIQEVSDGWFFLMVTFALFIIIFVMLKTTYTSERAFAGSSFMFMISSIFGGILGFIDKKWVLLSLLLVGVAVVWLKMENARTAI